MPTRNAALRRQLLEAGDRLARCDARRLSAAAVTRAAGARPGALRSQFGGLEAFRKALLFHWLDQMRDRVADVLAAATGPERLERALTAWLDGNRERPTMRAWMMRYRADAATDERIRERVRGFTLVLQVQLRDLGWLRAAAAGRLYAAAAIETAQAEFLAGRALPELRATLVAALRRG